VPLDRWEFVDAVEISAIWPQVDCPAVDKLVVSWGLAAAPILRALREQDMAVAARVAALPPLE